jgi:hypothetical protein
MFLDIDDRYFPQRNKVILGFFINLEIDALVHATIPSSSPDKEFRTQSSAQNGGRGFVSNMELFQATFPNGTRDLAMEFEGKTSTALVLPKGFDGIEIHHAHLTVRKKVWEDFRFHEKYFPRNEDSLFLRDILYGKKNIIFVPDQLSIYNTQTSAISWRAKITWLLGYLRSKLKHR